jgi:hypothetical protein
VGGDKLSPNFLLPVKCEQFSELKFFWFHYGEEVGASEILTYLLLSNFRHLTRRPGLAPHGQRKSCEKKSRCLGWDFEFPHVRDTDSI